MYRCLSGCMKATEKVGYIHPLLSCQLEGAEADIAIGDGHTKVGLPVCVEGSCRLLVANELFFGRIDLQYYRSRFSHAQFGPGSWVRRQAPDKVVDSFYSFAPVDAAGVLKDFRGRA